MLDNNIWTYLVEFDAVETLRLEAWSQRVDILACPAVVIEALQLEAPSNEVREIQWRRIKAMTSASWVRLMPEAYKEANEVRAEIERLHPEWLESKPNLREWRAHKSDWEENWWQFVRQTPEEASRIHRRLGSSRNERARIDALQARKEAEESGQRFHNLTFEQAVIFAERDSPGDPFDAWRGHSMNRWHGALTQRGPDSDWLRPWLRPSAITSNAWELFWTREVEQKRLPLAWLRWAFGHVQATRTTNRGTPIDNQIATYLPECDFFITADSAFADCVEVVRLASPVAIGVGLKVPGNRDAVDAVLAKVIELGSG